MFDGKKLKELRRAKDVIQEEVELSCEISFNYLYRLESGITTDPRISTVKKLSDYFNVPIEAFLKDA